MPDLSKDTVTPDKLVLGETAHDASGAQITGTLDTEAIRAEGVEAGKKSEYDAFWDAQQLNGNRREYSYFGAGVYIPSDIWLNPKYPFVLENTANNFMRDFNTAVSASYGGPGGHRAPTDLSGWEIDASSATESTDFFYNASVKNINVDLSNSNSLIRAFCGSNRGLVNNITVKVSEKCASFSQAFYYNVNANYCTDVVRFAEGSVIAAGNLNLSYCRQSKESLASVINALSYTTTGLTVTLRLAAVNTAFETSAGAADGSTSEEWLALAATKPNWTINLINS